MDPRTEMLLQRAASLRRAGRVEEAIAAYEQLLTANPELPDSWYNLAWLQRQARRYDQALAAYGEALKRGVRGPEEVHLNRAVILSDHLHRPEDAQAELERALALKPDYVPALLNLGNLNEDRGNRKGAEAAYRRALEAAPDDALALSRLASISHAAELDEELAGQLQTALARRGISAAERADLGFALAGLLDAAGRFDEAFEAATAANQASRAATGAHYDRAAAERYIDQLIASPPPERKAVDAEAPLFILGMYRSGSTLVEQILAGHSRVHAAGELDLIPELARRIAGYPQAVGSADESAVADWRDYYLAGLAGIAGNGALVTDKRPDNFLHIGLIKTLFPGAKIVHTRRNRLDNLVSLYFLHLSPDMAYALNLEDAAHWYTQHDRVMAHWRSAYPDDIFELDYDELVQSPRPVIEGLLDFLGLNWEDSVLDLERRDRPVKTASVWQVRQPMHARSSGRWRNYSAQIKKLIGGDAD